MKQIIFLSIVLSFLLCIIKIEEVLAIQGPEIEKLQLSDPRLQPQKYCASTKCTPTIYPLPKEKFDIVGDTKDVFEALEAINTQEHVAIILLTRLGSIQRLDFAQLYKSRSGKHLPNEIINENSGRFKEALLAVVTPLPIFYAEELRTSIHEAGSDEPTLAEILCSVNNFGIKSIVEFFRTLYNRSLKDDLVKDTSGTFQKVIASLVDGKRIDADKVDNAKAAADAKTLNGPDSKPWKTKPQFADIFGTGGHLHLRQVFIEYRKISGHEIEDDIKKEFPGPASQGLLDLTKCMRSIERFYADKLEEAMRHNSGPKMDRPLIRILVSRSEIDLEDIKKEYQKIYKKPLETAVADKIGGDYRRTLTNMIRGNAVEAGTPGK